MVYLFARIARDRPDILEDAKVGKYKSARRAAIDAGIVIELPKEDRGLEDLLQAWQRADLKDRQIFLYLVDEEIEAAYRGELLKLIPDKRPGPKPYRRKEALVEETGLIQIEALLEAGETVTGLAQKLGVTYRTVTRWRNGETRPTEENRLRLLKIAEGLGNE